MARQAEENYRLLKVGQVDLGELLRPHFARLLEETIKPKELAMILFEKDVISREQLDECERESLVVFQNLEIYRAVKRKNAGETLIYALYKTGNFHILQLLESSLDQLEIKEGSKVNSNNLNIPVEPPLNQATDNNGSLSTKKQLKISVKSDSHNFKPMLAWVGLFMFLRIGGLR